MFQHCIQFLIDGANERVMGELLGQGRLPNITRHVVERGTKGRAITCFPSTTGPAFTPIMTGNFPGTCNIPGVRWFDRTLNPRKKVTISRFRDYFNWGIYAFDRDLSPDVKTIFEYATDGHSILGIVNRGTRMRQRAGFFHAPYMFHKAVNRNDPIYLEKKTLEMFRKRLNHLPRYIFYYFPIIDLFSHKYGMDSAQVREAYIRIDQDIGQVAQSLKDKGIYDTTLLVITSDHGHENVHTHFDSDSFIEKKFKDVLYFPGPYRSWRKAEAINMCSGNSMTHIYVRGSKDWADFHEFPSLRKTGLVGALLEEKAIEYVMGRNGDGSITVQSQRGEAVIRELPGNRLSYQVKKTDPYGFENIPTELSWEDALHLTANTNYPDAILQSIQIFRAARTGDLVCAAASGYDLRAGHKEKYEHQSSHGSLHREHMTIPLHVSHPVIHRHKRSSDIFASILQGLGMQPSHLLDGESFLKALPAN